MKISTSEAKVIVENALQFWNTGDEQLAQQLYDSAIERHTPETDQYGVEQVLVGVQALLQENPDFIIRSGNQLLVDKNHVMHDWVIYGVSNSEREEIKGYSLWTIGKDGKIEEEILYYESFNAYGSL